MKMTLRMPTNTKGRLSRFSTVRIETSYMGIFSPLHVHEVIRFAVALSPALLYQRDIYGRSPLETATAELSPNQWRIHGSSGPMKRTYGVLKLLIYCLELDTRGIVREIWNGVIDDDGDIGYPNIKNTEGQNVLHLACRLPYDVCPPDGILIERLLSYGGGLNHYEIYACIRITVYFCVFKAKRYAISIEK
jgi:hypothetical protein